MNSTGPLSWVLLRTKETVWTNTHLLAIDPPSSSSQKQQETLPHNPHKPQLLPKKVTIWNTHPTFLFFRRLPKGQDSKPCMLEQRGPNILDAWGPLRTKVMVHRSMQSPSEPLWYGQENSQPLAYLGQGERTLKHGYPTSRILRGLPKRLASVSSVSECWWEMNNLDI